MATPDFGASDQATRYEELSEPQFTHGQDLLDLLGLTPGQRVLDIGCGTGRLAAVAARLVGAEGHVVGIDPSPPRIELARQRQALNLDFRVGNAEELSAFEAATFDVVYLNSVLNWIVDKAQALREVHRVLKPGGRLGISTTVQDRPNELWQLGRQAWDAASGRQHEPERGLATGAGRGSRGRGAKRRVTMLQARAAIERAGFSMRIFEMRTYTSRFDDVTHMIGFLQASACDNLLPTSSAVDHERFRAALGRMLVADIPEHRRADGIQLERYVLLLVADKPA